MTVAPSPRPSPINGRGSFLPNHALKATQARLQAAPLRNLQSASAVEARVAADRLFGDGASGSAIDLSGPVLDAREPSASSRSAAPRPSLLVRGVLAALKLPLNTLYKVEVRGAENLPDGPFILTSNHTTYLMDCFLLAHAAGKPISFWMYKPFFAYRLISWLATVADAVPVYSADTPGGLRRSIKAVRKALKNGKIVGVFPEGKVDRAGQLDEFKRGFELANEGPDGEGAGVPVVNAQIDGTWGSAWSLAPGLSWWQRFLPGWGRRVTISFSPPVFNQTAAEARRTTLEMGAESFKERIAATERTLIPSYIRSAKKHWFRLATADTTGRLGPLTFGKELAGVALLKGLLKAALSESKNVGVLLPPTQGGRMANLALTGLGKVPVNLDYSSSNEEVARMIAKGDIETVVTSRKFLQDAKAKLGLNEPAVKNLILLEDLTKGVPFWKRPALFLALAALPSFAIERLFFAEASRDMNDTATILFTSGTTGAEPKGVELTHMNIVANTRMAREVFDLENKGDGWGLPVFLACCAAAWKLHALGLPWLAAAPAFVPFAALRRFQATQNDGILGVLPLFHSFGYTMTMWLAALAGVSAYYHTDPRQADQVAALAARFKPTRLLVSPTILRIYLRRVAAEAFASLKQIMTGAEKLSDETAAAVKEKFGLAPEVGYGATEGSPVFTANVKDRPFQKGTQPGSVGRPLPGVAARVVDPDTGALVPFGQEGLLLMKGANVMKGYYKDPAKTAEVLKDGWYDTGDVVTMSPAGFITVIDRLGRFGKPGGQKIASAAIEEALQRAAGLEERTFVVAWVPDAAKGERAVVLHAGYAGDISALLDALRKSDMSKLAIPDARDFHAIAEIPLRGTGKVDLRAITKLARELSSRK